VSTEHGIALLPTIVNRGITLTEKVVKSKIQLGLTFMIPDLAYKFQIINEIHKEDILTQLNCLELLSDLTLVEHGLIFLDRAGIIKQLEILMSTGATDPLAFTNI
jgi:hypothetical protein